MLEPGSFDVCKNTIAPIIVMLDHSELDTEVSDVGMETVKSDSCGGMLEASRDTNSMLATI